MLVVVWNTCIVSTEEDRLPDFSQLVSWVHLRIQMGLLMKAAYHEPHGSYLR